MVMSSQRRDPFYSAWSVTGTSQQRHYDLRQIHLIVIKVLSALQATPLCVCMCMKVCVCVCVCVRVCMRVCVFFSSFNTLCTTIVYGNYGSVSVVSTRNTAVNIINEVSANCSSCLLCCCFVWQLERLPVRTSVMHAYCSTCTHSCACDEQLTFLCYREAD